MKKIILLSFILTIGLFAKKEFVNKHYVKYEDISTLQCVDSNNCYAFATYYGSFTRIYHSSDQGDTWWLVYEHDHIESDDDFRKLIHCLAYDTNNLYINYIYRDWNEEMAMDRSTDGGETFERIYFDGMEYRPGLGVSWMGMYNENIGAVVMTDGIIYTKDNWETLHYYIFDDGQYVFGRNGFFIDSTSVATTIDVTRNNLIKIDFENKEITQYSEPIPPPEGEEVEALWDMFMVNDTLGYGCGSQYYGKGYFSRDIIFKTTDAGKTWEIIYKNLKEDTFGTESIICRDENHILAEGSWQKLLYSTDGGETWEYLEIDEGFTIGNCVAFAGSYPLVSSWGGGIYRYEDVTSVAEPSGSGISIVPNPAGEYITLKIADSEIEDLMLNMYDINGNLMKTINYRLSGGYQDFLIDVSEFTNGTYVYSLITDGKKLSTGKFVIVK